MEKRKQLQMDLERVRKKLSQAANQSGLTQQEIGQRMGFDEKDGRKAVWRLINKVGYDARLSTVLKFAKAVGQSLPSIFAEE